MTDATYQIALGRGPQGKGGAAGETGPQPWRTPVTWQSGLACVSDAPATSVVYAGSLWICNTPHTSGSTFSGDAAKWTFAGGIGNGVLDTDATLAANSDGKIASQKATKTYVDGLLAAKDALVFKGALNCSANPNYPAADAGHVYKVSVAGKIGGASGIVVEIGDTLLCTVDGSASGAAATVATNWVILQTNYASPSLTTPAIVDKQTQTFSASDKSFARQIDPSGLWSDAPNYTEAFARFDGVNNVSGVPTTDAYGVAKLSSNIVATWGWNFATGGGRIDTTKPAWGFSLEYNYFLITSSGWKRGVEGHWKLQDAAGVEHRPITMWLPWDGGVGSAMDFAVDRLNFKKFNPAASDNLRVTWDFTTANFTQVYFSQRTQIQTPGNSYPVIRQINAAGTDYISHPYIGNVDQLQVSTPVTIAAPSLDVYSALLTVSRTSGTMANDTLGVLITGSCAAGASIYPVKANFSTTGTSDFTNWNFGGGNAYLSAWVAVGSGDAATVYNVNGGGIWTQGLDNSDDDAFVVSQDNGLGSNNAIRLDRTTLRCDFGGPAKLKSYTVAGLPSASTAGAGALVYVSDAAGGPTIACSNGTNWKIVAALGATVT